MTEIEHLLRETIGLDATSIGSSLIQRTVRLRMKNLGLKRVEDYGRLLQTSAGEWNELVESVVVTETWFFRDRETFTALVGLVLARGSSALANGRLRMLSVPCSSGEEPYSIAMALRDAGVPPDRVAIEAVDLSARALAAARRGVYRRNSFRGKDLDFRARYFHQAKEGFVLTPAIRSCVSFSEGNLLSEDFPANRGPYDFIFCRNLLIYFDRPTRRKALERIERLLAPEGTVFVGPAEQPLLIDHGFVTADIPMAFACRKPGHPLAGTPPRRALIRPLKVPRPLPTVQAVKLPQSQAGQSLEPERAAIGGPVSPIPADLERARRLADEGRLQEAASICEAHLRTRRASAQAWYLLGLVRDAEGDASAVDCYRKALYLEPNHYESLLQMALVAQKNGDTARARAFKRRADRIKTKT